VEARGKGREHARQGEGAVELSKHRGDGEAAEQAQPGGVQRHFPAASKSGRDRGVDQPVTRGLGEGSSLKEGISSGGGSMSGRLNGGFRWRGGGHTVPRSREGGGVCFRVIRCQQRREFDWGAISCQSRVHGERGV
jgi:hypothetical protein